MKNISNRAFKEWVSRAERDVLALGGVVFYFLVLGRALVGPFWDLFTPLIFTAVILLTVHQFYKDIDLYITRGLVVGFLTTHHYGDITFGVFSLIILIVMTFASYHQGNSRQKIINGLLLGIFCSLISYPIASSLL